MDTENIVSIIAGVEIRLALANFFIIQLIGCLEDGFGLKNGDVAHVSRSPLAVYSIYLTTSCSTSLNTRRNNRRANSTRNRAHARRGRPQNGGWWKWTVAGIPYKFRKNYDGKNYFAWKYKIF